MNLMTAQGIKEFIQRCKSRSLTVTDESRLFYWVLLPLLTPSGLGYVFIDVVSGDWVWQLPLVFFGPPLILMFGYLSYCQLSPRPNIYLVLWMTIWPIVAGLAFAFCCFGYFYWANALTGNNIPVLVTGQIVEKKHEVARYTGKVNILTVDFGGKQVDLEVSSGDFIKYEVGSRYSQMMFRGGLGYLYRWRFEESQRGFISKRTSASGQAEGSLGSSLTFDICKSGTQAGVGQV